MFFCCLIPLSILVLQLEVSYPPLWRGEEQNREEGEMAQKKLEEREIGGKSREEREKEKLGLGRIELDE